MNLRARILLYCLIVTLAAPAQAAIQQVRVLAVGIDRQRSAAEAKAVEYAKRRAVYLVAAKLGVDQASAKVSALSPEEFHEIVRGATVVQTRRENETTWAEVQVSVVDTALKRSLGLPDVVGTATIPIATAGRGVLILPVLMENGQPLLWQKENMLREAVEDEALRQSLGAVLVPAGDFDDLRLVDHQNVIDVTAQELEPMFKRYGADEIVVAIVSLASVENGEPTTVVLRRMTLAGSKTEMLTLDPPRADTKREELLARAAQAIATTLSQIAMATSIKEQEVLAQAERMPVRFRYANMRELAEMQESVRGLQQVGALVIPTIAVGDVPGVVHYSGSAEELKAALNKQRIIVTAKGDYWQLSLR